jgi:hypothetical protein
MLFVSQISYASYSVTHLNTTVTLNLNNSASVREILTINISNVSISQYANDRADLNLTLSNWQALIGPLLSQHIINPKNGVYNFKFLPGPPKLSITGQEQAQLLMSYDVMNVTTVTQSAPRTFIYSFNPNVLNFEHGASGVVLNPNTTLTIILPSGSKISTIFPTPDIPSGAFASDYANVTQVSWLYQEPLSKFTLVFVIKQSIPAEVEAFFKAVYTKLGIFTYIVIGAIIVLFMLYTYFKSVESG